MSAEEDLYLNGVGRAQTIYQQPSTGEKHVLFYPTSPAPSVTSADRKSWTQSSSNVNNQVNNSDKTTTSTLRANKKTDRGMPDSQDSGGLNSHSNTREALPGGYNFRIGIYGWRKRCLYILILVLLIMVIVNLTLTLWVLKVMEFSSEGMGQLKIVSGGVRLEGRAFILDSLTVSSIKSRTGQPIVLESSQNFTIASRNSNGRIDSFIILGNDRFECLTNNFKVLDDRGLVLFSANDREVLVGADSLRVSGEGGTSFTGSIQTNLVRAKPGHDLRLESPTRTMGIHAPQGINIESRGGKIKTFSFDDLTLRSEVGSIVLESSSILVSTLPTAIPSSRPTPSRNHEVFQLCVCENGKLFVAPSQHLCNTNGDDLICR